MTRTTKIQWTEKTWKTIYGCDAISPGCAKCYAMRQAATRLKGNSWYQGTAKVVDGHPKWTGTIKLREDALTEPLSWREPCMCFVNNMSDTFHKDVPVNFLDQMFLVMAATPHITFQVLTKRIERARDYLASHETAGRILSHLAAMCDSINAELKKKAVSLEIGHVNDSMDGFQLPNVWIGTSVEDRKNLDRLDALRATPAAVRFVSFEPLLEDLGELDLSGIHWAIFGGESGPDDPRPCDINWIRRGIEQCRAQNVRVFVKQIGANPVPLSPMRLESFSGETGRPHRGWIDNTHHALSDPKGGDPAEWPEDLRIREFPEVAGR